MIIESTLQPWTDTYYAVVVQLLWSYHDFDSAAWSLSVIASDRRFNLSAIELFNFTQGSDSVGRAMALAWKTFLDVRYHPSIGTPGDHDHDTQLIVTPGEWKQASITYGPNGKHQKMWSISFRFAESCIWFSMIPTRLEIPVGIHPAVGIWHCLTSLVGRSG